MAGPRRAAKERLEKFRHRLDDWLALGGHREFEALRAADCPNANGAVHGTVGQGVAKEIRSKLRNSPTVTIDRLLQGEISFHYAFGIGGDQFHDNPSKHRF